jgi:hypothetical protein
MLIQSGDDTNRAAYVLLTTIYGQGIRPAACRGYLILLNWSAAPRHPDCAMSGRPDPRPAQLLYPASQAQQRCPSEPVQPAIVAGAIWDTGLRGLAVPVEIKSMRSSPALAISEPLKRDGRGRPPASRSAPIRHRADRAENALTRAAWRKNINRARSAQQPSEFACPRRA